MVVLQPLLTPAPPRLSLGLKRGRPCGRARRALSLLGENNSKHNLSFAESLLTISAEEFTKKWNFDPIRGAPVSGGRYQWSTVPPGNLANHPHQDATSSPCPPITHNHVDNSSTVENTSKAESSTSADSGSHVCCSRTCACDANSTAKPEDTNTSSSASPSAKRSLSVTNTVPERSERREASSNDQSIGEEETLGSSSSAIEQDSGIDSDESILGDAAPSSTTTTSSSSSTSVSSSEVEPSSSSASPDSKLRQTCITDFVRQKKRSVEKSKTIPLSRKRPASSSSDQDTLNQPPHKKVLLQLRA